MLRAVQRQVGTLDERTTVAATDMTANGGITLSAVMGAGNTVTVENGGDGLRALSFVMSILRDAPENALFLQSGSP